MSEPNLSNFDIFFFYGEDGSDPELETKHNVLIHVLQPPKSFFYGRDKISGISLFENEILSLLSQISMKFDIASSIANYNNSLFIDEDTKVDRRFAVSQDSIFIEDNKTDFDIYIYGFLYQNYQQLTSIPTRIPKVKI